MKALLAVAAVAWAAGGCAWLRGPRAAAPGEDRVPLTPAQRVQELAFVRDLLAESYVHLDDKRRQWGVDPAALFERYRPAVERADTWTRLEVAMVAFVSEMHDAHLAWRRTRAPDERRRRIVRLGLETRFVGDALLVAAVWPGSDAQRAGVRAGDRVVGIGGDSVDQALGRLSAVRSWSRVEAARYDFAEEWPAARVPADEPPPRRRITRERPDGAYETLEVAPETRPPEGRDRSPLALAREGCVAVLRVRTLNLSRDWTARLPGLVDGVHDACGLVVDLRGNVGGLDTAARAIVTGLVDAPITGATFRVRLSPRVRAARPAWRELPADPARPGWSLPQPITAAAGPRRFAGPIVALVDAGCRSSCEALALLLHALGAKLVGERTGGSTGAPITVPLPRSGARVTVPVWAVFDGTGQPIEGVGVAPDETVAPTRDDVTAGRDPARERALALVRK